MDVGEAMEQNIVAHATRLHRVLPNARTRHGDTVIADSGLDDPTYNIVVATRFVPAGADRRIAETIAVVRGTGRPFRWVVGPSALPHDLSLRLSAAGLPAIRREVAMVLRWEDFRPPPPTGDLEIRPVQTPAEAAGFAAVVAANWDPPSRLVHAVLSALDTPAPGVLVGYVGGRPVSTALLVEAAGVSGLYMVCTLHPYRNRGYGTAITAAALRRASGRVAVLQASEQGESIYRRIGFHPIGYQTEHVLDP